MLVRSLSRRDGIPQHRRDHGCSVARFPIVPPSISPASVGIWPESTRGLITRQSAASQPTSKTRRGLVDASFCDTEEFIRASEIRQRKRPDEPIYAISSRFSLPVLPRALKPKHVVRKNDDAGSQEPKLNRPSHL